MNYTPAQIKSAIETSRRQGFSEADIVTGLKRYISDPTAVSSAMAANPKPYTPEQIKSAIDISRQQGFSEADVATGLGRYLTDPTAVQAALAVNPKTAGVDAGTGTGAATGAATATGAGAGAGLRDDYRYFPQPDVPSNDDYTRSFGREQRYYGYAPRSAAIDAANAAAGEKIPSNGEYTYNRATGQYTWVPAKPAAATTETTGKSTDGQGGEGGQDFGGGAGAGAGVGGGFPGATLIDGVSGPTTGLASLANSAAAKLGNLGFISLSDAIAKNVDPNFSHEGRQNDTDKSGMTNLGSFNIGPTGLTAIDAPTAAESQARADDVSGVSSGGVDSGPAVGGVSDFGEAAGSGDAYAQGGLTAFASGGLGSLGGYSDGGRLLRGPGDGVSDSIPATIGKARQPARLADGEFVVPARIVSELGNGSTAAGARKLYAMLARIQAGRKKSIGKSKVAVNSRMDKHLPA